MIHRIVLMSAAAVIAIVFSGSAVAADSHGGGHSKAGDTSSKTDLPKLPPDAHVKRSIQLRGKKMSYTATVGTLPVRDDQGKKIAQVVFTAYTVNGGGDRPVTFAFNGGPGASSGYLNLGAIGPKHLNFGDDGDNPSDPATLADNPGTWLGFTDLVFIDPVGTGYSRSLEDPPSTVKDFYSTDADIHYLSRIVYDWLAHNARMTSPKYLVGESYGGFRGPRMTEYLQTRLGVAMNGVVLISPYLDPATYKNENVSPLPWMMTLPPIAAAHLEREHAFTRQKMQKIIEYTETRYPIALMQGYTRPQQYQAMIEHVTNITGLDPAFVKRLGGRLDKSAYLRQVHRSQGKIGSIYDSNLTAWDPFPYASEQRSQDPILNATIAPITAAMVNWVTQTVGWKYYGQYQVLNYDVNQAWHEDDDADQGSVDPLRKAVATDSNLRVLIAHGWNDLSCPFLGSMIAVNQIPTMGGRDRIRIRKFRGGHMFYTRLKSRMALQKAARAMFGATQTAAGEGGARSGGAQPPKAQ